MNAVSILDIDLDFFLVNPYYGAPAPNRVSSEHRCWHEDDALSFLDHRIGLTWREKFHFFEEHVEIFYFIKALCADSNLRINLVHVDAHLDLGDLSSVHSSIDDGFPKSSNYMLHLIGDSSLSEVTFICQSHQSPSEVLGGDLDRMFSSQRNMIRRTFVLRAIGQLGTSRINFQGAEHTRIGAPSYDYVCLSRSPGYTPSEADTIYEAIRGRSMLTSRST